MNETKITVEQVKKHVDEAANEIHAILKKHITALGLNNTTEGWCVACRIINIHAANLYRPIIQAGVEVQIQSIVSPVEVSP